MRRPIRWLTGTTSTSSGAGCLRAGRRLGSERGRLSERWLAHYEEENFLVPRDTCGSDPDLNGMVARAGMTPPVALHRELHTTFAVSFQH